VRAHALLELRGAGDEVEVRLVLVRVVHLRVRVSARALHRAREAVAGDRLFSERLAVLNDLDGRAGLEVREVERRSCRANVADRSRAEPASLRQGAARRGGEEWPHSLGRLENRSGGRRQADRRARVQSSRAR
jgi:hypothetical protein